MAKISLQVLQGADRGKTFSNLTTPITIGREEGNAVQLNDERISRYHIKIQEDNDQLVLTDLDSTNGTQVNGQDCQLRIIRVGDIIAAGRSVLLVGSKEEIADHVESLTATGEAKVGNPDLEKDFDLSGSVGIALQKMRNARDDFKAPEKMTPCQAAQLSELLEQITNRLGAITHSTKVTSSGAHVSIEQIQWQLLLDLSAKLATMIRHIGDPNA